MDGAERTACSASKTTGGGTGPGGPKAVRSATLGEAGSSSRGGGWAANGPASASPRCCQARPEAEQEGDAGAALRPGQGKARLRAPAKARLSGSRLSVLRCRQRAARWRVAGRAPGESGGSRWQGRRGRGAVAVRGGWR
jgi:hypothetical protein